MYYPQILIQSIKESLVLHVFLNIKEPNVLWDYLIFDILQVMCTREIYRAIRLRDQRTRSNLDLTLMRHQRDVVNVNPVEIYSDNMNRDIDDVLNVFDDVFSKKKKKGLNKKSET